MDAEIEVKEKNVSKAEVLEDIDGDFGLFILPVDNSEICITEAEMRRALRVIDIERGLDV